MRTRRSAPVFVGGGFLTEIRQIIIPNCGRLYQLSLLAGGPDVPPGERTYQLGDSLPRVLPPNVVYNLEGLAVPDMAGQVINIGTGFAAWSVIYDRDGRDWECHCGGKE